MVINRKILLMLFMGTLFNTTYANIFPRGCEVTGFGYNGMNLVVNNNGAQAFYLIQNRSLRPIELQRIEMRDVFMSPPLTAKLEPNKWAAFASDIQDFNFQCFYVENDKSEKAECRDVLDICQYPRVKFALSNMGNYWVSVNKEQRQIINDATAKGIYLRW
ncbi:MAG: enhanced entry protein EnhB [Legionella sp.]|nr:enhanced entry protein EnhB [Legionella sp.]